MILIFPNTANESVIIITFYVFKLNVGKPAGFIFQFKQTLLVPTHISS